MDAEDDGTRCVNAAVTDFITAENLIDHTVGNIVGISHSSSLDS